MCASSQASCHEPKQVQLAGQTHPLASTSLKKITCRQPRHSAGYNFQPACVDAMQIAACSRSFTFMLQQVNAKP